MISLTVCLGHTLPREVDPSGNTGMGMLSRKGADYKCRYLSRLRSRLLSGNGQHTPGRPGITFGRTHITLKGAKKSRHNKALEHTGVSCGWTECGAKDTLIAGG